MTTPLTKENKEKQRTYDNIYGNDQRRYIVEDLNKKWMQLTLQNSPVTPLEHCEWLNKLFLEVWSNYINPKLSLRFASIVERRLKHIKSRLILMTNLIKESIRMGYNDFGEFYYAHGQLVSNTQQATKDGSTNREDDDC
ncbi:hypothetical protein CASFOL_042851 [Castilleja foliolosa]|uniref:Uncharacterized protein n=1 Tax=Castilleja foliolosa TaxID=1961234 RepID=A0ABD3B7H5_9LAMI